MTARDTDWDGVRLHVVTGKGGTGKTTVAAALALALAHGGRKVLLIETEGRQGIAQLFDRPPGGDHPGHHQYHEDNDESRHLESPPSPRNRRGLLFSVVGAGGIRVRYGAGRVRSEC